AATAAFTRSPPWPPEAHLRHKKGTTVYFPLGEPGPRQTTSWKAAAPPVKLLMNVEKLRLLTKAGTTVLLSAAERAGLSLSAVEWLGLLYKAEELEVLSAATDHGTPGALLGVALLLLAAGPAVVYLVTEEYPREVAVQAVVALACVVGGSATFAMSSIVSKLPSSPAEAIRDAHCLA
ncbi:Os11g0460900, partial [Oryza sativa Japonica Group]